MVSTEWPTVAKATPATSATETAVSANDDCAKNDATKTGGVSCPELGSGSRCIEPRYIFVLLGFLDMLPVYALRASIGIAMVKMVTMPVVIAHDGYDECGFGNGTIAEDVRERAGEFDWSESTQGIIFGSFFWGYLLLQLPAGRVAERFGGKWLFGGGVLTTCVCALLTPLAARLGIGFLVSVRFVAGLSEGALFPAMQNMLSRLALPHEKSKMATFIYAGSQVGVLLGMPIAGILCDSGYDQGWPLVFYSFGSIGVLWFGPWAYFVYGHSPCPNLSRHSHTDKSPTFPWKQALTSLPTWAIIVAQVTNEWGYYTLITQVPTYMKNILKFDIKQNSVFTALPYLGRWIIGVSSSCLSDYLVSTKKASRTTVVKAANFIGMVAPGVALVAIAFVGCGQLWNVILLTLAVSTGGAIYAGFFSNHMDVAPRFAGTLFALSNTLATVPGILAPYVSGVLMEQRQTLQQWHVVFFISAALYFLASIFYSIFASGVEQPWNKHRSSAENEKTVLKIGAASNYTSVASITDAICSCDSNVVLLSVNARNSAAVDQQAVEPHR